MPLRILDAQFVASATAPDHYPRQPFPEAAFVGRSNVGKSSLINALTHRKKLVRVSNTPGRTRALNFFDVTYERMARKQLVRLCDLPGYGFAKASKADRAQWHKMIETYLEQRQQLKVVVAIIDAEVGPTPDDEQLLEFLQELNPSILVAATKLDKLGKAARKPRISALTRVLELPDGSVFGVSATLGLGLEELWLGILSGTAAS